MTPNRLDRVLREPGARERSADLAPVPADIAEARAVLDRLERGRWLRGILGISGGVIVAGAVTVAVALAVIRPPSGLSSGPEPGAGSTAAATPSATGVPTPTPSLVGELPVCVPDNLAAVAEPWGAAAGSRGTTVTLTNTGADPCVLQGSPAAEITDASGKVVVATQDPQTTTGDPVLKLDPRDQAVTSIVWANWCNAAPTSPLTVSLRLVTGTVPVRADPAAPDVLVPPCMGTDPTSLSTIAFESP